MLRTKPYIHDIKITTLFWFHPRVAFGRNVNEKETKKSDSQNKKRENGLEKNHTETGGIIFQEKQEVIKSPSLLAAKMTQLLSKRHLPQ